MAAKEEKLDIFRQKGVWQEETEKLEEGVVSYYEKLFSTDHPAPTQIQEVLRQVPCSVTPEFNESLQKPYSKEEISAALLLTYPCKSPEPDDMHDIFDQRF